jgi:hypothetical protein
MVIDSGKDSGLPKKNLPRHNILLLAMAAASLAFAAWFSVSTLRNSAIPFERAGWLRARQEENWSVRSRMARDLVSRSVLIGQSRDQLIERLGDPESYSDATDRQLYYLIREDWDWIDPVRVDHLLISIDQNGQAADARIDVFERRKR